jgi:hypothetical protein
VTVSLTQNVSARALNEKDLAGVVRYLNREAGPLLRKLRSLVVANYAVTFGDGAASAFTLDHALGTSDVVWSIREVATGLYLDAAGITSVEVTDDDITVTLAAPPAVDELRLVVLAV